MDFATTQDIIKRYRSLTSDELTKCAELCKDVSSALRLEAKKCGINLDEAIKDEDYSNLVTMVTCDIIIRKLEQDTTSSNLSQESQSALGYNWSGTYVNTGGGTNILDKDLKRLGFKKQRVNFVDIIGAQNA